MRKKILLIALALLATDLWASHIPRVPLGLETMGTGVLSPAPPNTELGEYYTWLEEQWGFARQVIPIDYEFESVGDAAAVMTFFFGEAMGQRVLGNNWKRVPEWAGLWVWRHESF